MPCDRLGNLRTYGGTALNELGRHPEQASLHFLGICDRAAHEVLRCAFGFGKDERQPAGAARLRRTDRQALSLHALYNLGGKVLEVTHRNRTNRHSLRKGQWALSFRHILETIELAGRSRHSERRTPG